MSEAKQMLIEAMEKLIESKDPSQDERIIWALEEAMDLIEGILP